MADIEKGSHVDPTESEPDLIPYKLARIESPSRISSDSSPAGITDEPNTPSPLITNRPLPKAEPMITPGLIDIFILLLLTSVGIVEIVAWINESDKEHCSVPINGFKGNVVDAVIACGVCDLIMVGVYVILWYIPCKNDVLVHARQSFFPFISIMYIMYSFMFGWQVFSSIDREVCSDFLTWAIFTHTLIASIFVAIIIGCIIYAFRTQIMKLFRCGR